MLAMTLSGFSQGKQGKLWKNTCNRLKTQFRDPYLRVCFDFLCSDETKEDNKFTSVLNSEIDLWDKIAFSCRFLNNFELKKFISSVSSNSIKNGNLEGIIITGILPSNPDCCVLLQNFIDFFSDIQTTALLISNVSPLFHNTIHLYRKIKNWIDLFAFFFNLKIM